MDLKSYINLLNQLDSSSLVPILKWPFSKLMDIEKRIELYDILIEILATDPSTKIDSIYRNLSIECKKYGSPLYLYLEYLIKLIDSGANSIVALKDILPNDEYSILYNSSKHDANDILKGLENVKYVAINKLEIKQIVSKEASYPVFQLFMIIAVMVFIVSQLVSKIQHVSLADVMDKDPFIYWVLVIYNQPYLLVCGVLILVFIFIKTFNCKAGPIRKSLDLLPMYNVYKQYYSIVILILYDSLKKLNYKDIDAFSEIHKVTDNKYCKSLVRDILFSLKSGKPFITSIDNNTFDKNAIIRLKYFSNSDNLSTAITTIIDKSIITMKKSIANTSRVVFTILVVALIYTVVKILISSLILQGLDIDSLRSAIQ